MNIDLHDIVATLNDLPPEQREQIVSLAYEATKDKVWVPNPGPQTRAVESLADELFYGGQAGGGKSDLLIGLATGWHKRSLLLRRTNKEALGFVERMTEVLHTREGYNGQEGTWRYRGRKIDIGGCQTENDKQKYKGTPRDLYGFDEIPDFTETQYTFIIGWNRSADPKQRCRVVVCGNPPTKPEGLWVIKRWAAWLDPNHPNPAKDGELRWYTTDEDGEEIEVDGPGPHRIGGEDVLARSRTFIRAELQDNPDLAQTNYGAVLAALPPELRRAYRDGRFDAALKDEPFQVIPSAWVQAAQARWREDGGRGVAMTAMALDPAGGGADAAALSRRHGPWFAQLETIQGPETGLASEIASWVVTMRRNLAPIVVDVCGGYGGAVCMRLADNGIETVKYNGATKSTAHTRDGAQAFDKIDDSEQGRRLQQQPTRGVLRFANKRAESHWRLREELDPDQQGGSVIALPPDPELRADLVAPRWKLTQNGILVEPKEDIRARLGRSPNKGDAVVMCWSEGTKAAMRARAHSAMGNHTPSVITKRSRRR